MQLSKRNVELIVTSALMISMIVLVSGVGVVMTLIGGLFLPLSLSDTQLWSVLSPQVVIGALAGYIIFAGAACVGVIRYARRHTTARG
jgi:ABC-type antimicrobial peptide transport system permease subunit